MVQRESWACAPCGTDEETEVKRDLSEVPNLTCHIGGMTMARTPDFLFHIERAGPLEVIIL